MPTWWWWLPLAAHMFGGLQSATRQVSAADVVVVAQVREVSAEPDGVVMLKVRVRGVPCGMVPHKELRIHQLGDHVAPYARDAVAVFPLKRAADSPHRPPWLAPTEWTVDQAGSEMMVLKPADMPGVKDALTPLCPGRAGNRPAALARLLGSPVSSLAGGAAVELMTMEGRFELDVAAHRVVTQVLSDPRRAPGLRLAALTVAARQPDGALQMSAAQLLTQPAQPQELVAAAFKWLGTLPAAQGALDARTAAVLAGPRGAGKVAAARYAGVRNLAAQAPALAAWALADPSGREVACASLARMHGPEADAAVTQARCDAVPSPDSGGRPANVLGQ